MSYNKNTLFYTFYFLYFLGEYFKIEVRCLLKIVSEASTFFYFLLCINLYKSIYKKYTIHFLYFLGRIQKYSEP